MKEAQNSKADNEKIASKPLSYGQSTDATLMPNEMPSPNSIQRPRAVHALALRHRTDPIYKRGPARTALDGAGWLLGAAG